MAEFSNTEKCNARSYVCCKFHNQILRISSEVVLPPAAQFASNMAWQCRAGLQRDIKFATVVTDLTTCHNTWFHKDVDRCFVATQEAKERALKMGIGQHKVTVHGLPIRPAFSQKLPNKHKLRQQLGLDLQKPAVLLVGRSPLRAILHGLADGPRLCPDFSQKLPNKRKLT